MKHFETYFLEQLHLHPSMEPQDVLKLCYQAAFGAEHLLKDLQRAKNYLQEEFRETEGRDMPLYELISQDICRVNLSAWKFRGLPVEWLFSLFAASLGKKEDGEACFYEYLKRAETCFPEEARGFSAEEWQAYRRGYEAKGLHPVHHSDGYRKRENPAYRIVKAEYIRLFPILEKAAAVLSQKDTCVIAIDGRAASGKTTMAQQLKGILGADVVQMDDFSLPAELRTAERLGTPGGNVHHERFAEEVLPFLSVAEDFSYRIFDCGQMDYNGRRSVGNGRIRIVEGSYSCHPVFGKYADVTVFSGVDAAEQMTRIRKRNGEQMAEMFRRKWIPMEEAYFSAYQIAEQADIPLE